ncbi:MAG: ECF transporter S component [Acidaminococcales bacterium]|jgi:uncharacterized membrane protein|nr:ECF transporter S component [Acidaminococcales bacterium]
MRQNLIEAAEKAQTKNIARELCLSGILIALVFAATMFINIRLPVSLNGGLIHLGNVPLIAAAVAFGGRKGALAGAFGMSLFDLVSGWAIWAPFTFVIRGVMGYVIGAIAGRKSGCSTALNILAVAAGGFCMLLGYYLTEVILYGNLYAPLTSIPGNLVQLAAGALLGLPIAKALIKLGVAG